MYRQHLGVLYNTLMLFVAVYTLENKQWRKMFIIFGASVAFKEDVMLEDDVKFGNICHQIR